VLGTEVRDIFHAACADHWLIPAFNIAYLPMVEPICQTLREFDCFALIEVARPDIERFGAQSLEAVAAEYARCADERYVALHVDHVPVIDEEGQRVQWREMVREGIECGYHSVMIDGCRLPLDENIAVTQQVVEMAGAYQVPVEAELGAVLGHEPGPLPPYEELFDSKRGFTSPQQAQRFVTETGVDWLSVAAGNIHGAISGVAADQPKVQARLDIDHLRLLAQATGVPLVLHGGSGIPSEYLHEAVEQGIVKLNIGTEIRQAYQQALSATDDITVAQQAVAEVIAMLITERLGTAGTASLLR